MPLEFDINIAIANLIPALDSNPVARDAYPERSWNQVSRSSFLHKLQQ